MLFRNCFGIGVPEGYPLLRGQNIQLTSRFTDLTSREWSSIIFDQTSDDGLWWLHVYPAPWLMAQSMIRIPTPYQLGKVRQDGARLLRGGDSYTTE